MDIITLTPANLDREHICCALADKKNADGVQAKKSWLSCRMQEGLRFKKMDLRGKAFIEYLPAEQAWMPIEAAGYTLINCFWVAGSHKGHGYGGQLLAECEREVKDSYGIAVVVGKKKLAFLSDKAFFIKHGYRVCDTCAPHFELLVKPLREDAPPPRFRACAKAGMEPGTQGIDIFYTEQCPFTTTYIELIRAAAAGSGVARIHRIGTKETAQGHYCPVTTYSIFVDGVFHSQEILTPAKFDKLLETYRAAHS